LLQLQIQIEEYAGPGELVTRSQLALTVGIEAVNTRQAVEHISTDDLLPQRHGECSVSASLPGHLVLLQVTSCDAVAGLEQDIMMDYSFSLWMTSTRFHRKADDFRSVAPQNRSQVRCLEWR